MVAMKRITKISMLLFVAAIGGLAFAQPPRGKPGGGGGNRPSAPQGNRPAPSASVRPSMGSRPMVSNPASEARPKPPVPTAPNGSVNRPGSGLSANKPGISPGMGGMDRPSRPTIPTGMGEAQTLRPSVRPNVSESKPIGSSRPNGDAGTGVVGNNRPANRPIGVAPALPGGAGGNRPSGGGNVGNNVVNKPGTIPGNVSGNRPGLNLPPGGIGGNRPGGNDRPGINWPNRPGNSIGNPMDRPQANWKPGINNNGSINTVINNRPINNNFNNTNINHFQHNNFNNGAWGGYRPYGGYWGGNGYNPYLGAAATGYGAAWANNYVNWNRGYHPWYNCCYQGYGYNRWGLGATGVGLAIGAWGLASMALNFGYSPYYNPFVVASAPAPVYLNYTQPVINVAQAVPETGAEAPKLPEVSANYFDKARADFRSGDYKNALSNAEKAIQEFPKDAVMHEFRALCLFALKDYQQSSAAIHALLASGPGWDWTTLSSLYSNVDTYKAQLNALADYSAANPKDTAVLFLLGYHQMTAEDADNARETVSKLRKLFPKDPVVENMYIVSGAAAKDAEKEEPRENPKEEKADESKLDILGHWKAERPDGGTISLWIEKDGKFEWEVADKAGKKDKFGGNFTLEGQVLILERSSGGALMGKVKAISENEFSFRVIGGPVNDPGLVFKK